MAGWRLLWCVYSVEKPENWAEVAPPPSPPPSSHLSARHPRDVREVAEHHPGPVGPGRPGARGEAGVRQVGGGALEHRQQEQEQRARQHGGLILSDGGGNVVGSYLARDHSDPLLSLYTQLSRLHCQLSGIVET